MELPNPADQWLDRLCNLNVATTANRGRAPHKPLLLLCLIDMIEAGVITDSWIAYSPELFFRFQCYWSIVYERQRNRPDMRLPFHALGGQRDRVWERYTEEGTPSRSKDTTRLCRIDESLWNCLRSRRFRREARLRLVTTYFTPMEQIALCARLRQHALSGNDDPRNGLALSPDAHWMFDCGLWTAEPRDNDFIIIVAQGRFREASPHGRSLGTHHGKPLYFPVDSTLRPDPKHFLWHRRHRFIG